jgi:hypothetical protein
MRDFELDPRPGGGGHARGSGGFYHVSFRSGSRGSGACAGSAHDYITREGEYAGPDRDAALYTESGHMPAWAADDPRAYWDAADLYERANGRLYVSGDFALPRNLSAEDQVDLARDFVEALTDRERLPYTFAIHAGHDRDGQEHNPHVHVLISERQNDGLERSPREWFRRANREHPERGGALKSRAFHGRDWVEKSRETLAGAINEKFQALGRDERVDHRSYERQGVDLEPGEHFGPSAAHMVERGHQHDRLEDAAGVRDDPERLTDVEQQIARLEALREVLARGDEIPDLEPRTRSGSAYDQGKARDDGSRGR